jgi:hypothetical protein
MKKTDGNATPKFVTVAVDNAGEAILFQLGNGKQIAFDASKCDEATRHYAMMHGFKQKLSDGYASMSKDSKFAEAYAELADIIGNLYESNWFRRGGGTGGQIVTDLATAIAELKACEFNTALAAVMKADDEQRKTWLKNKKVVAIVASLKLARLESAGDDAEEIEVDL